MCLCAATGIIYNKCDLIFLAHILQNNPTLLSKASVSQIKTLVESSSAIPHVVHALGWTTIFAVKFSFLAFFKQLINRVTKIHAYYWIVGIITLLSWLFMIFEPFILCPQINKSVGRIYPNCFHVQLGSTDSVKCFDPSRRKVSESLSWLTNSLDILTDIMSNFS